MISIYCYFDFQNFKIELSLDEIGLTKCLNFRPSNYGKCPKIKLENLDILVPRKKVAFIKIFLVKTRDRNVLYLYSLS